MMKPLQLVKAVALLLVTAVASSTGASAAEERRVALVIGNSAYLTAGALANPKNDATAIAKALEKAGFGDVTLVTDLDNSGMRKALKAFSRKAAGADIAAVYYAGHGVEVAGQNYLIPVDAELAQAGDVEHEAIGLSSVLSTVEGANRLRLVILDACRNNPFKLAGSEGKRSVGRGLARVEPQGGNTLVAYSAREGTVALDGPEGENSPFATALIKAMEEPQDVRIMFGQVRDEVLASTGRNQEPFIYGSLGGGIISLLPMEPKGAQEPQTLISSVPDDGKAAADQAVDESKGGVKVEIPDIKTLVNPDNGEDVVNVDPADVDGGDKKVIDPLDLADQLGTVEEPLAADGGAAAEAASS